MFQISQQVIRKILIANKLRTYLIRYPNFHTSDFIKMTNIKILIPTEIEKGGAVVSLETDPPIPFQRSEKPGFGVKWHNSRVKW